MKKKTQIPHAATFNSKKSYSDVFSITLRTGNGIILGSNAVASLTHYLRSISKHFVLVEELEDDSAHLQGGIYVHPPIRQDHLAAKMKDYIEQIYKERQIEIGNPSSMKRIEQIRKHGVMVKSHNDFNTLVRYCLKSPKWVYHTLTDLHKPMDQIFPEHYCTTCGRMNYVNPWSGKITDYCVKLH